MKELSAVKNLEQWHATRKEVVSAVESVIGVLPSARVDLQVKNIDEQDFAGYVRIRVNFFVEEWDRVTAWIFVPEELQDMPALLCCHQKTAVGKDETAGVRGDPMLAFARHYAQMGYVTLAIDCVTAGERISSGLSPFDTASFYKDNPKQSVTGKMLSDHMRCIDVLSETRRVDPARIGVIGHGMGAYNALMLSAFDERVQVCVASCGFTPFEGDPNPDRWWKEEDLALLPKLSEAAKNGEFPFDWEHVLALAAPSPTLVITALNDEKLPNTKKCEKAAKAASKVYRLLGAGKALENFDHSDGHCMSETALAAADEWLDRWL